MRRPAFLLAALLLVPVTYGLKFYVGPAQWWVNNWAASAGYEGFFVCLWLAIRPTRRAVLPAAVGVALVTCGLEFAQRWNPPWLASIRSTFLGRALLGTSFSWWDLPAYPLACAAAAIALLAVWREPERREGGAPAEPEA